MEPNITDVKFLPAAHKDLSLIDKKQCYEVVTRCWQLRVNPIPPQAEPVISCKKKGYEIYRLKRWEFPNYRVLYAIDEIESKIVIFGIMARSENYDMDGKYMSRIINDYIAYFKRGDVNVTR